ncbi:MAG: Hint domain-containing protein [Hasllibacter sp.]
MTIKHYTFDFEGFDAGTVIDDELAYAGVTVSSYKSGNPPMIFDTANPTGGDHDLATDNLGKVLILSEDGKGSDPDDEKDGGRIFFDFDSATTVKELTFLDIDDGEKVEVKFYDADGHEIEKFKFYGKDHGGDNAQFTKSFHVDGAFRMEVKLSGSGAIDNLKIAKAPPTELDGIVSGTAGDDVIDAGYDGDPEGDRIDAGDGTRGTVGDQDVVDAGAGDDTIRSGAAEDTIYAGEGDDEVRPGEGDDVVFGGDGADALCGDEGNDVISGAGPNSVADAAAANLIRNGSFEDTSGMTETGYGYVGDGAIPGWDSPDGDDIDVHDDGRGGVEAADGDNWLDLAGSPGNTRVGQDVQGMEEGQPYILSFAAGDSVNDSNAIEVYFGGELIATIDPADGEMERFSFTVFGGQGDGSDRLEFRGLSGDDNVGASVDDVSMVAALLGDDGADDRLFGNDGDDTLFGGAGNDILVGDTGDHSPDTGDDVIYGGDGDDRAFGNGGDDVIFGEDGDDMLRGGAGDDTLIGGDGDDVIKGGDGDDRVHGDAGDDEIYGGDGEDELSGGDGADTIDGGEGDDDIHGNAGADDLSGGAGNDSISGGKGGDAISGGEGDDELRGDQGDDAIDGDAGMDDIDGGAGNDDIDGGEGDDTIEGGRGNDEIDGGDGDDTITDRGGRDTVRGGEGDDVIDVSGPFDPADGIGLPDIGYPGAYPADADPDDDIDFVDGGAGNDTIRTGDDADTILGGTGDDTIDAGIDDDVIDGGEGDDRIVGGEGNDKIDGGAGDDTIYAGNDPDKVPDSVNIPDDEGDLRPGDNEDGPGQATGNDVVRGGDGDDTIFGADDNDRLFGDAGDDFIDGEIDDDFIDGGTGDDTLLGGQGDDEVLGGEGDDVIAGGGGDDLIDGGEGADTLSGGADRDDFVNVNAGDTVDGGTDGDDFDTLFLGGVGRYRIENETVDSDGNSTSGTVVLLNEDGSVKTGPDGHPQTIEFAEIEAIVPCFTPGTRIATPAGERLVEELRAGDRVITRDNGIQEIGWIGAKALDYAALQANPHLKPILVKAGALGGGLPERDMLVSPQHRMLVQSEAAQLYFEEREVLVPAKHLVNGDTIRTAQALGTTYLHFMFERHEVVLSDGAWTESFQPGDYTLKGLDGAARGELMEVFPEISEAAGRRGYGAARRTLKAHEAKLLKA